MLRGKPTGTGFAPTILRLTLCVCALICALPAVAGTTWDGGGANASWGTANNWNPNGLPLFNGTETITLGTGFASGTTMTLDGTRYINDLVINTITGFTISAGTGGTLNVRSGNITRQDVAGTEAVQTISAGMVLGDPTGVAAYTGTWNIAGSNSLDITGNIGEAGGSRGINKTGAGTVILSGTNTFSGGLTLSAGIVSISSNSNLGAASGGLTFNGGTLQVTGNVIGTRAITMTGAGTFDVGLGTTIEESGVVSGNGSLSLINYGTLILSGSGSNGTGSTNIAGILSLRGTVALGTGNFTFNTGILELGNGNFTRALGAGAGQVNMSTATNGAGFAAYGADRIVNLGGSGATVTWGAGNFLAAGSVLYFGTTTADHTLDFQNGINLNGAARSIQILRGVGSVPEAKISGVISGAGASNLSLDAVFGYSAGSLTLSNGGNSYAGTTTINAGNLFLEANATGTAGNTVLGSGATDILVGNTAGAYDAGLLTNSAVTISRNIRAQSGNTGVITLGGNSASTSTFSGSLFLGTNSGIGKSITLTAAAGGTTTFSGVIQDPTSVSGPGLLRKSGAGTVVLSGVNTYAGGTSIDGGTLSISQSANLGANAGGVTINAGTLEITSGFSTNRVFTLSDTASTFQVDPAQTFTITSVIGGSGMLTKNGTGTLTLSGANTYTGGSTINSGTVIANSATSLGASGATATINSGTLDIAATFTTTRNFILGSATSTILVDPTLTFTANGVFSGTGTLNKTGTGTLTLGGANTYTGATNISAGILKEGTANVITDTSAVTVATGATYDLNSFSEIIGSLAGGGTVTSSAAGALTLTAGGDNTSTSFSGVIQNGSGTLSFTKTGTGTLTFTGANTYSGLTTVSAGILNIQNSGALGTTAGGTTVSSGATLQLQSGVAIGAEPLTLNGTGIGGFGALRNISGNNSFAGTTTLGSASTIYSDVGTLTLTGGIVTGGFTTTFGGAGNISQSGVISGTGALVKNGSGTVTLTGTNTFTGSTTVSAGTLTAAGSSGSALGSTSSITVNSGGTLTLGANDQINNTAPITLAGGTFAKGNFSEGGAGSAGVGALTLTAAGSQIDFGSGTVGVLTFASFTPGAYTLTINNWTGTANTVGSGSTDRLIFASDQSLNLSSFSFTGFAPGAMEIALVGGYYEIVPVPEPSTWIVAAFVVVPVGFHLARRTRRKPKRAW
jgi:fibronectin-binding autotransporter adhesin